MKGITMAVLPYRSIIILMLGTATFVLSQAQEAALNYRLGPIYRPHLYQINLTVPPSAFTPVDNAYNGTVNITFSVIDNSSIIELHVDQQYLQIESVLLENGEQNSSDVTQYTSFNNETDIMTIANQNIVTGKNYTLKITFNGSLSTTDMEGFYKSSYTDGNGTTKYLATTQFQPTSARRAFPCFDEPALKAEFEITIRFPTGMLALSNTLSLKNVSSANVTNGLQEVQFERTPVMSTYLIAFVISEFDCTNEPTMVNDVSHRICSRQEAKSSRSWAEEIGPKVLASLNNYTQINYAEGMAKLDQIAIPDFSAGAMENWGLVTYREAYLLWDPEESSNRYKQYVATIISHELAHQWFGNLVTMQWWSETFLNEGFATFFEYFTTHDVLPEWELEKQYVIDVVQNALRFDVLESIQPLQSNVSTAKEVMAKFNTISYHKGGSIFRMIEHIMGAANFRLGLQGYLKAHLFNNTVPEDLWTELNKTTNLTYSNLPEPLDVVLDSWIKNPGFPLVKATLNGNTVTLTQSRFLLSGNSSALEWFVPISYTTSSDANKFSSTSPREWLKPNSTVNITLSGNGTWIILNNQMTGFYRVNYDTTLWNRIGNALRTDNFGDINELNRAQIIDDLFNLARTNQVQYSDVFGLIEFLANDTSYFSWTPAFNGFSFLLERVGRESDLGQNISSHLLSLMSNLYESTPIRHSNESDQIYTLKQVSAQSWACFLSHPNCTQQLRTLYSDYKINGSRPNKNLRDAVYCTALRNSNDSSDWEFLWNEYLNATLATEKSTILNSLGCSTNAILLEGYLNMTLNDTSGIRSQDRYSVFLSVLSRNTVGIDVAARFLMTNYAEIIEKYQSMNSLTNMLMNLANKFTTQEEINMLKNFTDSSNLKDEYVTVVNSAISTAEANLKWMQQFENDLYTYYENSNPTPTTNPTPSTTPNAGLTVTITHKNILGLLVVISLFNWFN